jgi:hypothetical protein
MIFLLLTCLFQPLPTFVQVELPAKVFDSGVDQTWTFESLDTFYDYMRAHSESGNDWLNKNPILALLTDRKYCLLIYTLHIEEPHKIIVTGVKWAEDGNSATIQYIKGEKIPNVSIIVPGKGEVKAKFGIVIGIIAEKPNRKVKVIMEERK